MAILQISKIQQRSGNLVDLPQLDDAEFGWANDAKRLFIGKSTPNENVEILTSYSRISYSQLDGSVGNLNISNTTIADGQILAFDGTDWTNRGGTAGGLITLGNVANVKITGGAVGYVLQTDGLGNLSWTPKGTLVASILNVTKADPAVVTTTSDNFFTNGTQVTILDPQGMDQLTGNIYYANVLTSTTFSLYTSFDGANFSGNVDSTSYNTYAYSTVSDTTVSTNIITVANSAPFTANSAVQFIGDMSTSGITANTTYYILGTPPTGTTIRIATSPDSNASNVVPLQTTSGLTAQVYQTGGEAVSTLGSSVTFSPAGGTDTQIQYNDTGSLQGSGLFTYNYGSSILTLVGNANVSNLNATGVVTASRLTSNVATGTAPLIVTSTTRVANLSVAYSNVSDFGVVTAQTTGTYYPVFVSGNTTANYALASNANISFNAATGNLSVVLLNVVSNANVGNLGASGLITATGNITGGNLITSGSLSVTGNGSFGNISTTGNISAGNFIGNLSGNVTGNISGTFVAPGSDTQILFNDSGNANATSGLTFNKSSNLLTVTGNVSGGNLTTAGALSVTGKTTMTGNSQGVASGSQLYVTGDITAARGGNTGVVYLGTGGDDYLYYDSTGYVFGANTTSLQIGNTGRVNVRNTTNATSITSGALQVAGGIAVAGNSYLNIMTVVGNANVGNLGTSGLITATGNVSGGNLTTAGALSVTGNANVGNLGTIGLITATGNVNGGNLTTAGVVAATGNVSGGNLTTAGVVAATGNVSGGNLTTAGVVAATGNVSGGNLTTTGVVSASGNVTGANLLATSFYVRSITTGISAAGSTQGTATALTKEINVVSTVSSGQGVVLPSAVSGMVLIVNNTSANTLNVYPATGGAINSGSANAAYSHPTGASIQYYATSGTQWYTVGATFA